MHSRCSAEIFQCMVVLWRNSGGDFTACSLLTMENFNAMTSCMIVWLYSSWRMVAGLTLRATKEKVLSRLDWQHSCQMTTGCVCTCQQSRCQLWPLSLELTPGVEEGDREVSLRLLQRPTATLCTVTVYSICTYIHTHSHCIIIMQYGIEALLYCVLI